MLYREIIAVCSDIRTKHIKTLWGQNVELFNIQLVLHIVTTGLLRVNGVRDIVTVRCKKSYQTHFLYKCSICMVNTSINGPRVPGLVFSNFS